VRRYERERPGELVHVDVKKLGNIPDGGGHRIMTRAQGKRNRQAHRDPAVRRKVFLCLEEVPGSLAVGRPSCAWVLLL
jgi:hypothetical protein